MYLFHKYTLLIFIVFYGYFNVCGQSNTRPLWFGEINLNIVNAVDRFDEILENRKLSTAEILILRQFNKQELWFAGISFTAKNYDTLISGDQSLKAGYSDVSAVIRHYLGVGFWKVDPYIQAYLGVRTFRTNTFIEIDDLITEQENNQRDSSLLYGGGIGSTLIITSRINLNIGAQYLFGGASTFLVDSGSKALPLIDNMQEYFSITNTIKYQIGVTFVI